MAASPSAAGDTHPEGGKERSASQHTLYSRGWRMSHAGKSVFQRANILCKPQIMYYCHHIYWKSFKHVFSISLPSQSVCCRQLNLSLMTQPSLSPLCIVHSPKQKEPEFLFREACGLFSPIKKGTGIVFWSGLSVVNSFLLLSVYLLLKAHLPLFNLL